MKKKFIVMIYFIISTFSFALVSINPIYFNQRIDGKGGYQEYELENDGFETLRYKMEVLPVTNDATEMERMKKWIEVYPKVVTVKPKSSETVKVMIKADARAKSGEYSFTITPMPIIIPKVTQKEDKKIASIKTEFPLILGITVDGYVGELGNILKDVKIESKGKTLVVENNMKRAAIFDVIVNESGRSWRDIIKVEAEKKIEKKYRENTKTIVINEAGTEIELKKIDFK